MTHRHFSGCSKARSRLRTAALARGRTMRSNFGISGAAGCCGPRRGHRCTEAQRNIGTLSDSPAAADPDRTALIIDGRVVSYGELATAVERCAARLADSGLTGKG